MPGNRLYILICMGFIAGLVVGLISFHSDFSQKLNVDKNYPVDINLVQAYFKAYNTTTNSAVGYHTIISYVLVLNVTNPSNITLRLTNLQIDETNHVFSYWRSFSNNDAYCFYPNSTQLVAFTDNSGLTGLAHEAFNFHNLEYILAASFTSVGEQGIAGVVKEVDLPLKDIGAGEYIYGEHFGGGSYFTFINGQGFINIETTSEQLD